MTFGFWSSPWFYLSCCYLAVAWSANKKTQPNFPSSELKNQSVVNESFNDAPSVVTSNNKIGKYSHGTQPPRSVYLFYCLLF